VGGKNASLGELRRALVREGIDSISDFSPPQ